MNLLIFTIFHVLGAGIFGWTLEDIFGKQVLERTPAGLSIFYLVAMGVLVITLSLTLLESRSTANAKPEANLLPSVVRGLSRSIANRSLWSWAAVFVLLSLSVFLSQLYWVYFAESYNERFQSLSYKDLRNRRTSAATLRGWTLDRSGKLDNALAYFKLDRDGNIVRTFSLDQELSHLFGTERGTPGLERALYSGRTEKFPESLDVLTMIKRTADEERDVRTTIDKNLQAYIASQLEGRKGSIVVLDPQNGDLIAMYSSPSYKLSEAQSLDDFLRLEADKRDKPLLDRSTREFYVPGSTFKAFTMISAFRAGRENAVFSSFADGFRPSRGSRPIVDASQKLAADGSVGGACAGGCAEKDITLAFKVSSNQYFAQLAISLGRERLRETAEVLGMNPVDQPEQALIPSFFPEIWNVSKPAIANSISPRRSTIVVGKDLSLYDIGLEGIGQGYAGQMTPFQMAMIAAVTGNVEGKLMKTRIEADRPPEMFSQPLNPQQAARVRAIMSTVTEEPGGTGAVIAAKLAGTGIRTGGKTGTAEKLAPQYDQKGQPVIETRRRRSGSGEWEEYKVQATYERKDSWFISIAPIERPRLAIAVVVEDGGYGSRTAAPIAANIILKARELGLLGENYMPRRPSPAQPPNRRRS
ncbi:MAG: hypothetical protein IPM50_00335 [Acidobacteriota bacterium]|nr:MAG: hypothetical protein IPM50_00335 [Acidobacteriota bacterium]